MRICHHPDPSILISYAAGTLPGALSGVVACHLSMCSQCTEEVRRLELLGGVLLEQMQQNAGQEICTRSSCSASKAGADGQPFCATHFPKQSAPASSFADDILPWPLARYLGFGIRDVPWQNLPKGLKQYWVKLPDGAGLMRLLKAPPKTELLAHSHRGMELTMILTGIYTDHTGNYSRGEVTEMSPGTHHHPRITSDEECICIIASEQAPRYSKWYARALRPILGI